MKGHRLLSDCERFIEEFGLTPSRFGREACRDPRIIFDLRRGREPSARVVDRIHGFMRRMREQQRLSQRKDPSHGTQGKR